MVQKFNKPFWEEVKPEELKNDDIIFIFYEGYPSYDHYKIINGKWFNIFEEKFKDYFKPTGDVSYKILRQNYRFTTKPEEWFKEGTEAYLESEPWGDEESGYCASFRGWLQDHKTGKIGEDGEICPFEEFIIEEL